MELTQRQVNELIEKIQYVFDHPNQIDWDKIYEIFEGLIKNDIEIGESEIQYLQQNLKFNQNVNPGQFYSVVDSLFSNYTVTKNTESEIPRFESENPELVKCLNTLMFKSHLNPTLSYPIDYWSIMTQFEKLVLRGIQYNIDEIRNWLEFKQKETTFGEHTIDRIVQLAEFIQIYRERPPGYMKNDE